MGLQFYSYYENKETTIFIYLYIVKLGALE